MRGLLLKKKAQISHVFTYLIIILVVGVIAIFGYKSIMTIFKTSCDQESISFKQSLFGFIDEYSDKGSVHQETLKAPCEVSEICFAHSDFCPREASSLSIETLPPDNTVIVSNVDDCTANIFLKSDFTQPMGFSDKISLKGNSFQCFKARNGKFRFLFTGLGRKTQIESGWEN